ncbi:50S ribosomal protein L20 [Mycoplasma sp. SG1]|uniref:50S ribosomal protein L20 n=1 Tax=Mycoplasma sp. SG1 TaxID=2810348 RepID=UPI002024EC7F|nr:50S ribosomal protein L20 [Mycoplasma sp. SG1]URM53195.1 50S ribosomal protein L20 [Mycoplasma sp. SG1]
MRISNSVITRNRRKKFLKQAKGYFGSKHRLYRTAKEQVFNSLVYAYKGRKQRKQQFRRLWITRINSALKTDNLSYSKFIHGLKESNINLNRKLLSEIAIHQPSVFQELVLKAKDGLKNEQVKNVK